jgi:hypothetical protein
MQLERNLVSDHDATLGELHYCWAEFVTVEQFREGTKIKAQLAQHRLQSSTAAAGQTPPALPALSPRAVELGLSHSAPFGAAWSLAVSEFHKSLRAVNAAVDSFNLTVPSAFRQRVHYSSEGIVQGVEGVAPDRDAAGTTQERRVRERIASFRRSRKGTKATLTASNHLAASINGAPDGATLSLAQLAAAEDSPAKSALLEFDSPASIDTSGLTETEMEALYRSLSSGERTQLEQEEARRRRLQQNTALPPAVVAALLATSAAVIALPVWLAASRKQMATADDE